jgi:hypothetical protein
MLAPSVEVGCSLSGDFLVQDLWIVSTLLPFVPRYVCGTSRGSIRGSNKGPISVSLGFLAFPKVLICFGK